MHALFVANWKMNFVRSSAKSFVSAFVDSFTPLPNQHIDVVLAPPFPLLQTVADAVGGAPGIALGTQNVHWLETGAHTGEVSPAMIRDFGATFAIVGHSERRQFYGEHDETVALRAKSALAHGIRPIVCVGESTYFESDEAFDIVGQQLSASLSGIDADDAHTLVVAYEPVWAIGTGRAATPAIIAKIHRFIRAELVKMFGGRGMGVPILYGGSTNPENIAEILTQPNVSGALVGGASLKPDVFVNLILQGRTGFAAQQR